MRLYNKVQVLKLLNQHLGVYPTPMNLNWNWSWGSLSGLLLASQIVTGILLAMHYVGHVDHAFASVQHLMVDVPSGVIIRYAHANGASLFFTVVYLHVLRGLYYSSGTQPREIVWISGVVILLLMIITAFIGYNYSQKWIFNGLIYHIAELLCLFYFLCRRLLPAALKKKKGKPFMIEDFTFFLAITVTATATATAELELALGLEHPNVIELLLYNQIFLLNVNSKNGTKLSIPTVKSYDNLHLKQTQYTILTDNKQKAGIYLIYNKINANSYIGSATSNRISVRFRNHCIHNTGGNKPLTRAIHKYGLDNFSFHILEYFPGFVQKENFNKNHIQLLELETSYLLKYKPIYNILTNAGSSVGLKHTEETINKMKTNYSEQRRELIGNLNKDKTLSDLTKKLMSEKRIELFKDADFKTHFLSKAKHTLFDATFFFFMQQPLQKNKKRCMVANPSCAEVKTQHSYGPKKEVFLYDSKGVLISQYESVNMVSQVFSCDRKTVRKYLDNPIKMFKNIGYLKTKKS